MMTTQLWHVLATQFSLGALNHTGLVKQTRAFLDDQLEKGGPSIYTLSPEKARTILSGLPAIVL